MKIFPLNVCGLGGLAKQRSLHTLFSSFAPDLILLQETMCSPYPSLLAFSKLRPSWEFCATSAKGLSGGLLSGWDPLRVRCRAYETSVGILVKARIRGTLSTLSIMN